VLRDILRLECGEAAAPDVAKAAPRIPDDARRKLAQVSAELEELGFELSATNPDAAGKLCAFATYLDHL
jgi:hypothetical protein